MSKRDPNKNKPKDWKKAKPGKAKPPVGKLPYPGWKPGDPVAAARVRPPKGKLPKGYKLGDKNVPPTRMKPLKKKAGGGKVGSSIKTYSSGGYVEGK